MNKLHTIEGSVSFGTNKTSHLIMAFLDEIRNFDDKLLAELEIPNPLPSIDDKYWESFEASYLLEELFDILDNLSPPGYYFGAHPSDGVDYGWWRN
jgi:hypothetical protein